MVSDGQPGGRHSALLSRIPERHSRGAGNQRLLDIGCIFWPGGRLASGDIPLPTEHRAVRLQRSGDRTATG